MKSLLMTVLLCISVAAFAQKIELSKADEVKIKELTGRMSRLNQDMLNNSAAAFDAISSRLDGVKVESKDFAGDVWAFSFGKIRDRAIGLIPLTATIKEGVGLFKELYAINASQEEKEVRISEAKTTNKMKDMLARIAERRTTVFAINEDEIVSKIKTKYKTGGTAYLTNLESSLVEMNIALQKTIGGVKYQTLIFQFEILQELINGLDKAMKNKEFVVCAMSMNGCDMSGWESSLINKTPNCPTIIRARYEFTGGLKQPFTAAANSILTSFAAAPDVSSRLALSDLDIDFHLRIHPPGCTEDCSLMVPVSRTNRKVTINGNFYWNNCSGRDGIFLYGLDRSNKLYSLIEPIVQRIARGNYIYFDSVFFEDVKVPY